MALKPTIYKLKIALSDTDRSYYDSLSLTVARHPSETAERMTARVLAYCLHAEPALRFTAGLSTPDQPDIWTRPADDLIDRWIDVGEPAAERIKKATRLASRVAVYSFNAKSNVWWRQEQPRYDPLDASVYRLPFERVRELAALLDRTTDASLSIADGAAYLATERGAGEVSWDVLQQRP